MRTVILVIVVSLLGQVNNVPAPNAAAPESVDVRYARLQVQLAEANLKRVEQSNQQVARSVPSSIVAEYKYDVQVAKIRLEQAAAGRAANEFQVWLQRAGAEQKSSETAWRSTTAANKSAPGTFDPLDIERFRLRAEVAKVQLERGAAMVNAGREAQMHWEIDLLDNQVQRLKEESRQSVAYPGYFPYWP